MNENEIWRAIDTQRLRIADLLADLTDEEWRQPSLCDGWTVRDVAAHLTLQETDLPAAWRMLRDMAADRGVAATMATCLRMNQLIHDTACRQAALPVDELISRIRGMVGSRKHNAGVTHLETLTDILTHGLDIALPLGRSLEVPADAAAVAAARMWSRFPRFGWPFYAQRRLAGLRLTATDTDWTVGQGRDVHGPMAALLLLVGGRDAALAELAGEGVDVLRARAS